MGKIDVREYSTKINECFFYRGTSYERIYIACCDMFVPRRKTPALYIESHVQPQHRQSCFVKPENHARYAYKYTKDNGFANIHKFFSVCQILSSCNKTFSFSSLSSHLTSICMVTSTLCFFVISNWATSQKLYPFLKNPIDAHSRLGVRVLRATQSLRQRAKAVRISVRMESSGMMWFESVGEADPDCC